MSNTRALVSCTILSLQDSCFVYPCCKGCLSRLSQESNKRATCVRCGFTCDLQNVDYRYRLSFKVSKNQDIFGVTVFGGCLNPFFGITAGDLHRFIDLEKPNGTYTIQQLLIKAVEDCFIGRCIVFGLKVSYTDAKSQWADNHTSSLALTSRQLVACQIISPSQTLIGSTVIGYLKNLLQVNLHSRHSESAKNIYLSQQKDLQISQGSELYSFDYSLPSCAKLNSQLSSGGFTPSCTWKSPGLCFISEELNNDSLQQFSKYDLNTVSPQNEDTRTCKCSLEFLTDNCLWSNQSHVDQLKHVYGVPDGLKDETQNSNGISSTSSSNMFELSAHASSSAVCDPVYPLGTKSYENYSKRATSDHCLVSAISGQEYDASLFSHFGQNICIDFEDAPLSDSLDDFISVEFPISEIIDSNELRLANMHSLGKTDQIIQDLNRHTLIKHSMETNHIPKTIQIPLCGETSMSSPMCNENNIRWKENIENKCPENLEIENKANNLPNVLCTPNSSCRKRKKIICSELNMPFSPDVVSSIHPPNRNDFTLQRKRLTKSRLSVACCPLNHEEGKYFRHRAQTEVHSVNCKVKQKQSMFDEHGDKYNWSADLFASCQSTDMDCSDVSEMSKVNKPKNVSASEPGVSGFLFFSPCLQSTPVSYYGPSLRQKTGQSQKPLHSRELNLEFKSSITDLRETCENTQSIPKVTLSELDQLKVFGSRESLPGESDMQYASCSSSANVNEWSRDLFEN
ncbi:uncharacterized protein ddias [Xyrauchen texanus]|uniref:uncharacterized protein ddias n=1 Tax=Xyrauchen texanus TaxID=154827 RepID=UPI002242ADA6|nr:uncharacterized protein ddias [Xyrauchen texanus]